MTTVVAVYRPEVDGLRAVAVVAVILYHAGFNFFSGGYVGVDIFFVISGYLITFGLLGDLSSGKFTFTKFYERRVRRIFPALFFVMISCMPFVWYLQSPGQLREFSQSILAVTLFFSNHYFLSKTGYFGVNTDMVPLLHTWSLSVEEQFYVMFPVILLMLWRYWRVGLKVMIPVLSLLSLGACIWFETRNASLNFFSASTRAWELMVGAMVAIYRAPITRGWSATIVMHQILNFVGIGLIGIAVFGYTKSTLYPGHYAIAPVAGTALLLLFCTSGTVLGRILSTKYFVGIGLVSYSAYLWHQPLFVFARHISTTHLSSGTLAGLIMLTGALSYLSWKYIEKPFRQPGLISRRRVMQLSIGFSLLFLILGFLGHRSDGFPNRFGQIGNELILSAVPSPKRLSCHNSGAFFLKPEQACRYFSEPATWAVLGDSHGVELAWALAEILRPNNEGVLHLTNSACPPALLFQADCTLWIKDAVELLSTKNAPHTVVLAFRHSLHLYGDQVRSFPLIPAFNPVFSGELSPDMARDVYWKSFSEIVQRLKSAGKNVVVIEPIPELSSSIDRFIFKRNAPGNELLEQRGVSLAWYMLRNDAILKKFDSVPIFSNVLRVHSSDAFCDSVNCFAVLDGKAMYFDDNHLSVAGAERLAHLVVKQNQLMNAENN